jgi:hypothetical protein
MCEIDLFQNHFTRQKGKGDPGTMVQLIAFTSLETIDKKLSTAKQIYT